MKAKWHGSVLYLGDRVFGAIRPAADGKWFAGVVWPVESKGGCKDKAEAREFVEQVLKKTHKVEVEKA